MYSRPACRKVWVRPWAFCFHKKCAPDGLRARASVADYPCLCVFVEREACWEPPARVIKEKETQIVKYEPSSSIRLDRSPPRRSRAPLRRSDRRADRRRVGNTSLFFHWRR